MSNSTIKKPIITTEIFISKAISKHGDKYDYSDVAYNGLRNRVVITCKNHGEFSQIAAVHLSGGGCPRCKKNHPLDTETFKSKANAKHGGLYGYEKSIYVGLDKALIITCKAHGDFSQTSRSHLNGGKCPNCRKHVFDNETFVAKSKSMHGNKYEYLNDSFTPSDEKVKVICREHGVFEQKMDNHFRYDGCKKCKTQRKTMSAAIVYREDKSNYSRRGYIEICKNNNGMSNLYVVEMSKDSELFYKIGITKRSIEERFRSNPYKVRKVRFITEDAGFIFDLEKRLHKIISEYHYKPQVKFEGSTLECFSRIPKEIINLIDSMGESNQLQLLA